MTFDEYSRLMRPTAFYPMLGNNMVYPALAAAEEAGELAGKIKKVWRDHGIMGQAELDARRGGFQDNTAETLNQLRQGAIKEIGDVLWYLDAMAIELGTTLEACAQLNVEKILDRQRRGTLSGSGDNR